MLLPLILTLPWLVLMTLFLVRIRLPRVLPPPQAMNARGDGAPLVSVVVPARDEAHNIVRLLDTLTASTYPRFEVVVVDDQSADGTAALARGAGPGRAERLEVVDGAPLPAGWLGKPWACWQGALGARGELLLFTDADTRHGQDLLSRAVAGLEEDRAHVVTVAGRQLMESFWERVVQPQVFWMLLSRFGESHRPLEPRQWRNAIASGQFILFRRETYDALGGHEAVRDEVVEDLRLAQLLVRGGHRLSVRLAEDDLATRMYRSLGEIVSGWSKNILVGGLQSVPPWMRPFLAPASVLAMTALWPLPPFMLLAALLGAGGGGILLWASATVILSLAFWMGVSARMGVPAPYGLLYPLGAAVVVFIQLRAWARGSRVEWKGREYRVQVGAE